MSKTSKKVVQQREEIATQPLKGGGWIFHPEKLEKVQESGMRASYNVAIREAGLMNDEALEAIRRDYEGVG